MPGTASGRIGQAAAGRDLGDVVGIGAVEGGGACVKKVFDPLRVAFQGSKMQ